MTQKVNNNGEELTKIIDRVLKRVFGKEATQLIYKYLETEHSLRQDEVARKIDLFAEGLEDFLDSGAYVVEQKILEDIYSSYGLLRRLELERMQEKRSFVGQVRLLTHLA